MFTYSLICWLYAHHGGEIFKIYKYFAQLQSGFALKVNYVTSVDDVVHHNQSNAEYIESNY